MQCCHSNKLRTLQGWASTWGEWGFGQAGRAWGLCVRHVQHAAAPWITVAEQAAKDVHVCVQIRLSRRLPRLQRAMFQPRWGLLQHRVPGMENGRSGPAWPGTTLITAPGQGQTARWGRECGLLEVASSLTAPERF